jgi:hypothetical protein
MKLHAWSEQGSSEISICSPEVPLGSMKKGKYFFFSDTNMSWCRFGNERIKVYTASTDF